MSNVKYDAITGSGIEVGERVQDSRRAGARRRARRDGGEDAAGYFTDGAVPDAGAARGGQGARPRMTARPHARRPCTRRSRRLRQPATIRAALRAPSPRRSARGQLAAFRVERERLDDVAERVARADARALSRRSQVPYHSRWRHFEAGGVDRKAELDARLDGAQPARRWRARASISRVDQRAARCRRRRRWRYREAETGSASRAPRGSASRAFARSWPARSRRRRTIRCASMRRRWRGSTPATLAPRVPGRATTIRWSGSRAARRCCGGWATRSTDAARRVRRAWRARAALFDALTRDGTRARFAAPAILRALLDGLGAHLADRQRARRRRRSATCGGIRTRAATGRPPAGCRSTSCRSGSPTRCSSRSSGPACAVHEPRRADRPARVPQRRPAARHRRARAARRRRRARRAATSAASWSSSGAR